METDSSHSALLICLYVTAGHNFTQPGVAALFLHLEPFQKL
jgi:hypothetical protein